MCVQVKLCLFEATLNGYQSFITTHNHLGLLPITTLSNSQNPQPPQTPLGNGTKDTLDTLTRKHQKAPLAIGAIRYRLGALNSIGLVPFLFSQMYLRFNLMQLPPLLTTYSFRFFSNRKLNFYSKFIGIIGSSN